MCTRHEAMLFSLYKYRRCSLWNMQKELEEIKEDTHPQHYVGCENMKVTHARARVPCLNQLYQLFSGKI